MRFRLLILAALTGFLIAPLTVQDLSPRAYVITPVHSNALTLTWSSRAEPAIEDNLRSSGKRVWVCGDKPIAYGIGSNTPPAQTVSIAAGRSSSRRDMNT